MFVGSLLESFVYVSVGGFAVVTLGQRMLMSMGVMVVVVMA